MLWDSCFFLNITIFLFLSHNSDPRPASEQAGEVALRPPRHPLPPGPRREWACYLPGCCSPSRPQVPGVCFMDGSVVSQYDNVSCENFISLHCLQSLCVCLSTYS